MRLIFMGTPDFAVPCLQSVLDAGHEVCAVFTQPDKPKGRGYVLTPPPVKVLAEQLQIPVYQPATLRNAQIVEQIRALKADCILVVAYGKLLPAEVLAIPHFGCINVHASLLPKYRGAAPYQWAVINGDTKTGVTTMYLAEGLDTGDMLLRAETEIGPDETAGELHDRLSVLGADLLVKTLESLQNGTAKRIPQGESDTDYARMLTKEMGKINWGKPAQILHNLIRGLSPWPTAYTTCLGKRLKIHKSQLVDCTASEKPGYVLVNDKDFLVVCGNQTVLRLLEVQYEGGKRMPGALFLRGHADVCGTVLGE